MKLISNASALNIRTAPSGPIIGELQLGDLFESDVASTNATWTGGVVVTGNSAGKAGYVRRKWMLQYFASQPALRVIDRSKAASILSKKTADFDAIHYKLGDKAKNWEQLQANGYIDCSGWIYLLAKDIIASYELHLTPGLLFTFSDEQITNLGNKTGAIISGKWLTPEMFQPGCLIGLDFAEYSWDRNRPLDIDHIVMVGEDSQGKYITQSSSSGGGVNRVPLAKWLSSTESLRTQGRMHLVDLLAQ